MHKLIDRLRKQNWAKIEGQCVCTRTLRRFPSEQWSCDDPAELSPIKERGLGPHVPEVISHFFQAITGEEE